MRPVNGICPQHIDARGINSKSGGAHALPVVGSQHEASGSAGAAQTVEVLLRCVHEWSFESPPTGDSRRRKMVRMHCRQLASELQKSAGFPATLENRPCLNVARVILDLAVLASTSSSLLGYRWWIRSPTQAPPNSS